MAHLQRLTLLHPRLQRFDGPQLWIDPERNRGALRGVDRVGEDAKACRITCDPVEQQGGAFGKPSGNLRYSADFQIRMCTMNVAQHIGPLNFGNEFAQVLVDH